MQHYRHDRSFVARKVLEQKQLDHCRILFKVTIETLYLYITNTAVQTMKLIVRIA